MIEMEFVKAHVNYSKLFQRITFLEFRREVSQGFMKKEDDSIKQKHPKEALGSSTQ
jgi:hypothetical protein